MTCNPAKPIGPQRLEDFLNLVTGESIAPQAQKVTCPSCQGRRYADSPSNQRGPDDRRIKLRSPRNGQKIKRCQAMPLCAFCKGLGYVFPDRVCECGWPALFEDLLNHVWSCGATDCMAAAKRRKEFEAPLEYTEIVGDADGPLDNPWNNYCDC